MAKIYIDDLIIKKFDGVLMDILNHGHTHYSFPGGRGGTKSSFIGIVIPLLMTQNKKIHAVVFRRYANTLRDTVFAQIRTGISMLDLDHLFKATVSPMEITYLPTGQKIYFRGIDEPEKIKSIKTTFGYIGITWFEEFSQFAGRNQLRSVLQSTMRGGEKYWNFESMNPPITRANWANIDLLVERPDRLVTWSNYLDVPREWLGEQFFTEAELLKQTNEMAYRNEYLGEAVGNGGNVFTNIIERDITGGEIMSYDRVRHGVDWGYYPDPWVFVSVYFHASTRTLYVFDEMRANKKTPQETGKLVLAKVGKEQLITCDSTPAENTADYTRQGLKAVRATKGPGSVDRSIQWMQGLTSIVIDKHRCPHTYKELLQYEYERNKDGDVISAYPDKDNHSIDAIRYATETYWHLNETPRQSLLRSKRNNW